MEWRNQYNVFVNGSRLIITTRSAQRHLNLPVGLHTEPQVYTNLILITKRMEAQDNLYQAEIFNNLLPG